MVLLLVRSIERWNGQRELSKPMQALFMLAFAIALGVDVPVALALLPFAIIYGALEWRIARAIGLDKRGYFGGHFVRGTWLYEEVCNQTLCSLRLELAKTEPGHWEMFFPTDEQWRARVPEWAKDRRREIAIRIAGRLKAKDFHSPADLGAINARQPPDQKYPSSSRIDSGFQERPLTLAASGRDVPMAQRQSAIGMPDTRNKE